MNKYMEEAKEYRKAIDTFAKNQSDKTLIDNKAVFEFWGAGINAEKDKIYRYGENIYKCIQPHTTQEDWTPDKVPALEVLNEFGVDTDDKNEMNTHEGIKEWINPKESQKPYNKGDKCYYKEQFWVSTIDNNISEPGSLTNTWINI